MTVRWRYEDAEGRQVGASEDFPDRAAAEEWMGEAWSELLDRGVERVSLVDEAGRRRYRMGLRES